MSAIDAIRRCALAVLALPSIAFAVPVAGPADLYREMVAQVRPQRGYRSKIALGNSIVRLTRAGVIDRNKLEAIYTRAGGAPGELSVILDRASPEPIRLTAENARFYVNMLWPLGLANRMGSNERSPLNGPSRFRYASTGGWTLGRATNGGAYFNAFPIVELSAQQDALVARIAQRSFRPCCSNSTFYQDCNHGSALLGLLALGAAQGLGEEELYREALAFNSFWFPEHYAHIALYFKEVKGVQWRDVDPRTVMGAEYSSAAGMQTNVMRELQSRNFLPRQSGADCSV